MNKALTGTVGIDVDSTVVDLIPDWLESYKNHTGKAIELSELDGKFFEISTIMKERGYPIDFWSLPDIYDNAEPMAGSQSAIQLMVDRGLDVFFITTSTSGHMDSKERFLAKFFPGIPIIHTKQKHVVKMDLLIDDGFHNLVSQNKHQPNTALCMFKAPHNVSADIGQLSNCQRVDDWAQFMVITELKCS